MGIIRNKSGQMTVELAVMLPVIIIIAVIATNALLFFSDCAAFDRVARDSVRINATSPAYGQNQGQSVALVKDSIQDALKADYLDFDVEAQSVFGGYVKYTATLTFSPNLFGMGFRSEVLGVSLPKLVHHVEYVVDPYKAGVIV